MKDVELSHDIVDGINLGVMTLDIKMAAADDGNALKKLETGPRGRQHGPLILTAYICRVRG